LFVATGGGKCTRLPRATDAYCERPFDRTETRKENPRPCACERGFPVASDLRRDRLVRHNYVDSVGLLELAVRVVVEKRDVCEPARRRPRGQVHLYDVCVQELVLNASYRRRWTRGWSRALGHRVASQEGVGGRALPTSRHRDVEGLRNVTGLADEYAVLVIELRAVAANRSQGHPGPGRQEEVAALHCDGRAVR